MRLKILSLWQPHATLCVTPSKHNPEVPAKPVETRSWSTEHRGWLGIHSAMKKDPHYKYLAGEPLFSTYIENFDKLPFGYILGMVEVTNCHPCDSLGMLSRIEMQSDEDVDRMKEIMAFGDFTPGRFGTTFTNFVKFTEPIRASGTQGFWYHEMPHNIGARVKTSEGYGIIIDHREDHLHNYLVHHDGEGKRDWFNQSGFTVVQPAQRELL